MTAVAVLTRIGAVRAGIGVIELDATISTSHSFKVQATQHPVERGASITDHLRPEPDVVTLEGIVSDTPVSRSQQTRAVNAAGVQVTTTSTSPALFGVPGYAAAAFAKLLAIKDAGALVTLATELRTYTDMAITSLEVPRNASTGDALRFSATFQKIVLVENKVTQVRPAADPRANPRVKRGRSVIADIQHTSKVFRKTMEPWKQPHAISDATTGISDRFHKIVFTSVGTGIES